MSTEEKTQPNIVVESLIVEQNATVGSLTVHGKGKIEGDITVNGQVGIGTETPETKLHVQGDLKVTGEIKGKIWYSQEYKVTKDQREQKMLPTKNSVAFLTFVSGRFDGYGEGVWIEKKNDENGEEYWYLRAKTLAPTGEIEGRAICIGTD